MDGDPQGSGTPCEVHAGMACERQQKKAIVAVARMLIVRYPGLPYIWHTLHDRHRRVVYMERITVYKYLQVVT